MAMEIMDMSMKLIPGKKEPIFEDIPLGSAIEITYLGSNFIIPSKHIDAFQYALYCASRCPETDSSQEERDLFSAIDDWITNTENEKGI